MKTLSDALRSQPLLALEAGYQKWIAEDDLDALNAALAKWGLGTMTEDGDIVG